MKEVPLTQGMVALVDDEDYEMVSRYRWFGQRSKNGRTGYAMTNVGRGRKGTRRVYMHQLLMTDGDPRMEIDHRNGNGLDNRRANLRWATRTEQRRNQPVRVDSRSGFKGVEAVGRKWVAYISQNGKKTHLGTFSTAEDAARAHDAKAVEIAGEFAWLNFPDLTSVDLELTSCSPR